MAGARLLGPLAGPPVAETADGWILQCNQADYECGDPEAPFLPHPRCSGPRCSLCGDDARTSTMWVYVPGLVCTGCSGVDCGQSTLVCRCKVPLDVLSSFVREEVALKLPSAELVAELRVYVVPEGAEANTSVSETCSIPSDPCCDHAQDLGAPTQTPNGLQKQSLEFLSANSGP
jgi:hypothetical protein